jgi:hypothetical protein
MPPAFALSQDQTLRFISVPALPPKHQRTDPYSLASSAHHAADDARKAFCNASKRYIAAHFAGLRTNKSRFRETMDRSFNQPTRCSFARAPQRAPPTYPFLAYSPVKELKQRRLMPRISTGHPADLPLISAPHRRRPVKIGEPPENCKRFSSAASGGLGQLPETVKRGQRRFFQSGVSLCNAKRKPENSSSFGTSQSGQTPLAHCKCAQSTASRASCASMPATSAANLSAATSCSGRYS